ncbi:MAG: FHA domain-containing protein [Polyangiaceae bacterium]|nr:FHA domain-containing protein [Polyangiaceae bacterium]
MTPTHDARRPIRHLLALAAAALLAVVLGPRRADAAPEAHILRVDPRASTVDGSPVLTTVIEVVQNKRLSDITKPCVALSGDANLDCVADALEQPSALYSSFDFPDKNAIFTVTVDGTDLPAKFESKARWGDSAGQPGVGTAWLILIDAASSMGGRFDEAKAVASAFVNAMQPNDIVDVMFFNDRGVVEDSKWVSNKQAAAQTIGSVARTFPTQGRTRPLFTIIKNAATDAFKELGNAGQGVTVPMHQAMVVLSNGSAGADPTSTAAASNVLREYLTKGRFPENNEVLPKTPVPVISIWFPNKLIEEFAANAREFMEGLANTEIGGFFIIVRDRQEQRAANIVNAVRTRFNKMHIVKWRVSCVAPSITQTFKLAFMNTNPPIAGDATFQNVPVGIDPSTWPLDVDREATARAAQKSPIYPGSTVKIFGNFCWGGNAQRAEIYMVPKNQAAPQSLQGGNIEDAKKAQRTLIEGGMRGKAVTAGDSVVEFELPNTEKFLVGKGDQMTARLIVYDNQARRTSALTADKIVTLKAREAPLPYLLIGGVTFGGVVIVLLVVSIFRGGGGGRRRGATAPAPPRPIVAGAAPPPAPGPYAPPMAGPPPGDFGYGGAPGMGPPPGAATRGVLSGAAGIFTVHPGMEMRAGRDGAACQILLTEPRVSGTHASVKLEGGQLLVRDEGSNNGTFVNGQRLPAGVWTPVGSGALVRFGPVEFSVRLE